MSRRIALVVAVLAATVLASGTFGFTSVGAERGLDVAVVDDDEAFVGLDSGPLDRCGRQRLVTVTNRFAAPVEVSVDVVGTTGVRIGAVTPPDTRIRPGEAATATVRLRPDEADDDGRGTVTVRVEATGEGVRSVLTRTYPVRCAPSRPGGNETG